MTLLSQVMTAVCTSVPTHAVPTHLSGLPAELVHDLRGQPGHVRGGELGHVARVTRLQQRGCVQETLDTAGYWRGRSCYE